MPQTYNFTTPISVDSSGLQARSVQYWAYGSYADRSVEVAIQDAHYVIWDLWTGRNLAGTYMGRAQWGNSLQTAGQQFRNPDGSFWTIDQVIANLYPPPGGE